MSLPDDLKHYRAESGASWLWAALATCLAIVGWVERVPEEAPLPYIAPAIGLQRYEDCTKLEDGRWLRFQIVQKNGKESAYIACAYGDVVQAVTNEWRTM